MSRSLCADDDVDVGRASENGLPFLLSHAPGHGDQRPPTLRVLQRPEFAEPREQLLLGPLADAAGVQDHDVGVFGVVGRLVASLFEQSGHALRVMDVHLAAERLDRVLSRHVRQRAGAFAFALSLSPFVLCSLSPCLDASISLALARAAWLTSAPPIMRASSASLPERSSGSTSVDGAPVRHHLADSILAMPVGRNLREMSDAEDLEAVAERPELPADRVRDPAADPDVDLVEDQRLPRLRRGRPGS